MSNFTEDYFFMNRENVFDVLRKRGFIEQTTDDKSIRKLLEIKEAVCYIGFDPSAPSLHVGHLQSLIALLHLKAAKHRPIALIGGGTGLVGDPADKDKSRPLLSQDKVLQNSWKIRKQIENILNREGEKVTILDNANWLSKLRYVDFLREIGSRVSVNKLLGTEWVKKRLKLGLSFLEFSYQLLQAYDFWYLFKNQSCEIQLGGSDQWSNILSGIDLIRRVEHRPAYGITMPLLTTSSGKKMGKTEKGALWLDANLFSPYDFYQYWINTADADVKKMLLLFTLLSIDEIKSLSKIKGEKIKKAKEILAYEATAIVHGRDEADKAREASHSLFGKNNLKSEYIPTYKLPRRELKDGITVSRLFFTTRLSSSVSDARRLIKQGGGTLNQTKIKDPEYIVTENDFENDELLLRSGKKRYYRIRLI